MDLSKIPKALADLPQWVLWKEAERHGNLTKVPFQTTGIEAKSNDPQTWTTLDAVTECLAGYAGPGFMFSHYDPFVGIDLDGCRNPETKKVAEWARVIIKELNSYTEISPSQTGVKIWVRGKSPFATGKNKKVDAEKVSTKEPGIEIYDKLRYFAVTGQRVAGVSPEVEARDLGWLQAQYWPTPKAPERASGPTTSAVTRARAYIAKADAAVAGEAGHNTTFAVACVLIIGFDLTEGDAMMLLKEYNARCQPPWSDHELAHKLKSAAEQPGERGELLNARNDWQPPTYDNYEPYVAEEYRTPEVEPQNEQPEEPKPEPPKIVTLEEVSLSYLARRKRGDIQFVETGLPDLDTALCGGIEKGEVVIIAGRPSHGKTALALQWIHWLTANGIPTYFLSLDMAPELIGKRAIQFASPVSPDNWKESEEVEADIERHFEKRERCQIEGGVRDAYKAADMVRRSVEYNGTEIFFVDYLQKLQGNGNTMTDKLSDACEVMGGVGLELGITTVLLCQLNREVEGRTAFTPKASDVKGTGQLEQDTDVLLMPVYPWMCNKKNEPWEFTIHIVKNRNRGLPQGAVQCRFDAARQTLTDETPEEKARACENYNDQFDDQNWK